MKALAVIPTANRLGLLERLLRSARLHGTFDSTDIMVVAQGYVGADKAKLEALTTYYGVRHLLQFDSMIGTGMARHNGLESAVAAGYDLMLALDDDMHFIAETDFSIGYALAATEGNGVVAFVHGLTEAQARKRINALPPKQVALAHLSGGFLYSRDTALDLLAGNDKGNYMWEDLYLMLLSYLAGRHNYVVSSSSTIHQFDTRNRSIRLWYEQSHRTLSDLPLEFLTPRTSALSAPAKELRESKGWSGSGFGVSGSCLNAHAKETHLRQRTVRGWN